MTTMLCNRAARRLGCLGGALLAAQLALAQVSAPVLEMGLTPDEPPGAPALPLDDITHRSVIAEHPVLPWTPVREADILWEKRIWRVIDVREKQNLPFVAPESPLFKVVAEAAQKGELTLYDTGDDRFSKTLSIDDLQALLYETDTVYAFNYETGAEEIRVVQNERNWEDVKRFRLKESWYFDTRTGQLQVRILGIAPLYDVTNEDGDFLYELPLFWVHYPTARPVLARHKAVTHTGNYAATTSWEDLLEMRYFASTVLKENNVADRRLQDYVQGRDALLEANRIEDALFNREHDLWSW